MTVAFILLSISIAVTGVLKMSVMPVKISLTYAVAWGVAACLSTIFFTGISRQQFFAVLDMEGIITFEFIELIVMAAYVFSTDVWEKVLGIYPGLMMIVPVCAFSFMFARFFPGLDFTLSGIISGCIVFITVSAAVIFLRYVRADKQLLYSATLSAFVLNVIIYGLL